MAIYFLDTSAIVKRYIAEPGQAWVLSICDAAQQHDLYISQVALVEVVATICRRTREQSISLSDRDRLIAVFRQDSKASYKLRVVQSSSRSMPPDRCTILSAIGAHAHTWGVDHWQEHLFTALVLLRAVIA